MDTETTTPATATEEPVAAATEGEVGLAGSVTELRPIEEAVEERDSLAPLRHALASRLFAEHGQLIARPVSEWGLLSEGDDITGHMILVDVDTLEKVRAYPGSKVPSGRVFCNGRNLPPAVLESL